MRESGRVPRIGGRRRGRNKCLFWRGKFLVNDNLEDKEIVG